MQMQTLPPHEQARTAHAHTALPTGVPTWSTATAAPLEYSDAAAAKIAKARITKIAEAKMAKMAKTAEAKARWADRVRAQKTAPPNTFVDFYTSGPAHSTHAESQKNVWAHTKDLPAHVGPPDVKQLRDR